MTEQDLKSLAQDYSDAVLKAAARKATLTQDDIDVVRAAIIREFVDIIGPLLP